MADAPDKLANADAEKSAAERPVSLDATVPVWHNPQGGAGSDIRPDEPDESELQRPELVEAASPLPLAGAVALPSGLVPPGFELAKLPKGHPDRPKGARLSNGPYGPSKLTHEIQQQLIGLIKGGAGKGEACAAVGISASALRRMRQRQRAGDTQYDKFILELEAAEAQVMAFGAQTIFKAAQTKTRVPFCRHCKLNHKTVECEHCESDTDLRCNQCNRKLRMEVEGDWRAMTAWLKAQHPKKWGERINLDVQGQLRDFLLACRDEFEDDPATFQRILDVAIHGGGAGVQPDEHGG